MNDEEILTCNILDPLQTDLSSDIFIPNKKVMKSKVKDYLIDTIYKWLKLQGYEKEVIKSIHLIGSSAGYHYLTTSDMDVSIETSIPVDTIKKIWKLLPNGNKLPGSEHPINFYLTANKKDVKETTAAYNILDDKWVKEEKDEKEVVVANVPYAFEIARFFLAGINNAINEYELDTKQLTYLKSLKEDDVIQKRIELKEIEIKSDLDSIYIAHTVLKLLRKAAFDYDVMKTLVGNSDVKNFSFENLTYKLIIDQLGYEEIFKKYEDIRSKMMEQK